MMASFGINEIDEDEQVDDIEKSSQSTNSDIENNDTEVKQVEANLESSAIEIPSYDSPVIIENTEEQKVEQNLITEQDEPSHPVEP
jgi:hypothetical protein